MNNGSGRRSSLARSQTPIRTQGQDWLSKLQVRMPLLEDTRVEANPGDNRRRHIRCPEEFPICKRCKISCLDCHYSSGMKQPAPSLLVPQPCTAIFPNCSPPNNIELALFGIFCRSTVKLTSGPFNQSFWEVDVPRAAAAYPAMWHACIASAAIRLSITAETATSGDRLQPSHPCPNSQYYILALHHFNKSVRGLAQVIAERGRHLSYADQEMAIMTNVLYVGITILLKDSRQMVSHFNNLLRLLESVRFGERRPPPDQVIMPHDTLFYQVLSLDGSIGGSEDVKSRFDRPWVVSTRSYKSFENMTQAYIAFLPILNPCLGEGLNLTPAEMAVYIPPNMNAEYKAKVMRFKRQLEDLRSSTMQTFTKAEDEAAEIMTQLLELSFIDLKSGEFDSREQLLRYHKKAYEPILDRIEYRLSQPSSGSSQDVYSHGVPFQYSPSYGCLLEFIASCAEFIPLRLCALDVMRKWPYNAAGSKSDDTIFFYEAVTKHGVTGAARTRACQLAGNPVIERWQNGGLQDREFDGTKECECLADMYICRDHKRVEAVLQNTSEPRYIDIRSRYERRYDIPCTRYFSIRGAMPSTAEMNCW